MFPDIFPREKHRRASFTFNNIKGMLNDNHACRDTTAACTGCYGAVKRYVVYAAKTAGRRGMTLFDVITDLNTFLILWHDDDAAYWACFLLSSIMLPYIVFWASSHNFEDATRAHTLFNKRASRTCNEKITRLYYCLIAMPVVGLVLTLFQITMWWFTEIFLGIFWQSRHQLYVSRMEQRENVKFTGRDISMESEETQVLFRSVPMIPSVNAARYLTIIELFFESIPQCILQIYIYVLGTSSYFTLHDVVLSVSASLLNIGINSVTITQDAHSVGMNLFDYIVYFMGNRIGDMLSSLVPVNKVLNSSRHHVCNLTGFSNLYLTNIPEKMGSLIRYHATPNQFKTIVLPSLKRNIDVSNLEKVLILIIQARYKKNIHVTMLANTLTKFTAVVACPDFLEDSKRAFEAQRGEACTCVENCQEGLNVIQCCSLKCGDMVFGGEKEFTIDEALHVQKTTRCCPCFTACTLRPVHIIHRTDSTTQRRNKLVGAIKFLWPAIADRRETNDISLEVANTLLLYALVGDYSILLALYNVFNDYYLVGNTFGLLAKTVHGIFTENHVYTRAGRKRWCPPREEKGEETDVFDETYRPIPLDELERKTFEYEIICGTVIPENKV